MNGNSEIYKEDDVELTCRLLSDAIEHQSENEEDIFQVLMHVSPHVGHLLPLNHDLSASFSQLSRFHERSSTNTSGQKRIHPTYLKHVSDTLVLYYVNKIKRLLPSNTNLNSTFSRQHLSNNIASNQLFSVCACLEKLQVLIGEKQTLEKFRSIVIKHFNFLLQQLTTEQNAVNNLPKLAKEFSAFGATVKTLIKSLIKILSGTNIIKQKFEQVAFIQETILEKLSFQLLTLSDFVRDSHAKRCTLAKQEKQEIGSNKQKSKLSTSLTADVMHLSSEVISNFASILTTFLSIEHEMQISDTLSFIDYDHNGRSKRGVLKQNPLELPSVNLRAHQHSSFMHAMRNVGQSDWCETFREIMPILSNSAVFRFNEITQLCLLKSREKHKICAENQLNTSISICNTLSLNRKGQPKLVLSFVGEILGFVLKWLPLAILGGMYRYTSKLQTDFLDVVNQSFKEVKTFLMVLIEDVPEKVSPSHFPAIMSSCSDVVKVLQYCGQKMHHDTRIPFQGTIQLYKSVRNHVLQHMVQYHKTKLVTVLLHEPESNYWSDPRAFYEGERCSYSVDVWKDHIINFYANLRKHVDDETAQKVTGDVFCDSISVLADRYCNCNPSYNRHPQVRLDIKEILQFSFFMLWKIIDEPQQICPKRESPNLDDSEELLSKIHSGCTDLFTCVNILAAPLIDLYAVVCSIHDLDTSQIQACEWVSAINPSLFPVPWNGAFNDLSSASTVMCILRKMVDNPERRTTLTIEALTVHDCFLSQVLINKKEFSKEKGILSPQALLLNAFLEDHMFLSKIFMFCFTSASSNLMYASLADAEFFQVKSKNKRLPWQDVLHRIIMLRIGSVLSPAINFMASHTWSSSAKSFCLTLPGVVLDSIPGVKNEDTSELVLICMSMVLQGLQSYALSFTDSALSLLVDLDKFLSNKAPDLKLLCDSYGSHMLLYAAHCFLSDNNLVAEIVDASVNNQMTSGLQEVAHLLLDLDNFENTFSNDPTDKSNLVMHEVQTFKQCTYSLFSHTAKIRDDLDEVPTHFSCLFETESLDDNTLFFINQLSRVLIENFDNLAHHFNINIPKGLPEQRERRRGTQILDSANVFGEGWDWKPSLLHCLITQPPDVVAHLLHQRPEMQKSAYLTDQEKDQVSFVKHFFNINNCA